MLKKIVAISFALFLLGYIIVVILVLGPKKNENFCSAVDIVVVDTLDRHFIDSKDILLSLNKTDLFPVGKKMNDINTATIDKKLAENPLIKRIECYKAINNRIKIKIYQKIPLIRVMSDADDFYVDTEGKIMPAVFGLVVYLPVVTGKVNKEFAQSKLYDFALFLKDNKFWNAQIEQIHVLPNNEIELITRVGEHRILLGKLDDYPEKLDNLKLFYEKGLNQVGWNQFSIINLKYKNQVICTKKSNEK